MNRTLVPREVEQHTASNSKIDCDYHKPQRQPMPRQRGHRKHAASGAPSLESAAPISGQALRIRKRFEWAPSATVLKLLRERERTIPDLPLIAVGDVRYQSDPEPPLVAQENPTRGGFGMPNPYVVETIGFFVGIQRSVPVSQPLTVAGSGYRRASSRFKTSQRSRILTVFVCWSPTKITTSISPLPRRMGGRGGMRTLI